MASCNAIDDRHDDLITALIIIRVGFADLHVERSGHPSHVLATAGAAADRDRRDPCKDDALLHSKRQCVRAHCAGAVGLRIRTGIEYDLAVTRLNLDRKLRARNDVELLRAHRRCDDEQRKKCDDLTKSRHSVEVEDVKRSRTGEKNTRK